MQFICKAPDLRRHAAKALVALALLLPFEAFADTATVLAGNRVRLTQAEIQRLGFFAQFEPALPTDQVTALYLIFPERIDGRKFIDASAELVDMVSQPTSAEIQLARNEAGEKLLVINEIDPKRIESIEFVLQYGADMKYEIRIDVASLNMVPVTP